MAVGWSGQLAALNRKNILVMKRKPVSTAGEVGVPIYILLWMLVIKARVLPHLQSCLGGLTFQRRQFGMLTRQAGLNVQNILMSGLCVCRP